MHNTSLIRKRKQLLLRIILLGILCVAISLGGKAFGGGRFRIIREIDESRMPGKAEELKIGWDQNELPVNRLQIQDDRLLVLEVRPPRAGDFEISVKDREGELLFSDKLRVDAFGTAYSAKTGNFTGDNAAVFGITLFFLGLAAFSFIYFFPYFVISFFHICLFILIPRAAFEVL